METRRSEKLEQQQQQLEGRRGEQMQHGPLRPAEVAAAEVAAAEVASRDTTTTGAAGSRPLPRRRRRSQLQQ